jgi:DNA-binding response OmpR family regulator
MRVLLVEGQEPLLPSLSEGLERALFAVDLARDGEEADSKARHTAYDVIVLDLSVPGVDGLTLLRSWRRDGLQTHLLAITSAGATPDRARCLDSGADDCLSRPIELAELVARLRALLRRRYQVKDPVIRVHDLEIHTPSRAVRRGGRTVLLTPREYSVLEFLAFRRGSVSTRTMIWEHIYGEQDRGTSSVVDVYIRYLREKIDRGFHPPLILTRWGAGYMLRGEE